MSRSVSLLIPDVDVCAVFKEDLDHFLPLPEGGDHERGLFLGVGPVDEVHQLPFALLVPGVLNQHARYTLLLIALESGTDKKNVFPFQY